MTSSITISDHKIPDDTHDYYDVTFHDDTILTLVTDTPSYVDAWISDIERLHRRRLHHLIVGLDIEWRPNFNHNYENPVATLQLCVGHRCLIFQILRSPSIPLSLRNFLRNRFYTFTGVGIGSDVEKLEEEYNLEVWKTVELRDLAVEEYRQRELRNAGLRGLTRRVLGKELCKRKRKGVAMSRWDNQWLNPAQVQYACVDAFLSFEIGRVLITGDFV